MASEEIEFIKKVFDAYYNTLTKNHLYSHDSLIPKNLIYLYFSSNDHLDTNTIANNYRRKYLRNENLTEHVHNKEERAGLRVVYDYLLSNEWKNFQNIYVILKLHQLLYSKTAHPEVGGSFRNANNFIAFSDVNTSDYHQISEDINKYADEYKDLLINKKETLLKNKNMEDLFDYINRSIILKCNLIEIHPFQDGNGRVCRALLNILFQNIGLPPVYVKPSENAKYVKAMDTAIRENDYSVIEQFYYYKICDSMVELDIKEQYNNRTTNKVRERK